MDDKAPPTWPTPSVLRRMGCWLYEALMLCALLMGLVLVQSAAALLMPVLHHPMLLQLSVLGLFAVYFVGFWTQSTAQTLPMKTWRIRVLTSDGRRLTRGRALARFALCWVWVAPVLVQLSPWAMSWGTLAALQLGWVALWALLAMLHPQRQFWHDALAGTRLVDVSPT